MSTIAIVMIAILLITISILIITVLWVRKFKKNEHTKEIDYRAFFILGISFLPMGIIFTTVTSPAFIGFIGIGVCYIAIGLAHRDKWKKEK
ncbi:MAG: hypothetical protein QCI00_04960 [Candidatus Thermoplasmatota archaeon]|nr:hypothetical protein [Candidatus Thermoplasmatota archaeon]